MKKQWFRVLSTITAMLLLLVPLSVVLADTFSGSPTEVLTPKVATATITFVDPLGGLNATRVVEVGQALTDWPADPSYEGFAFTGWFDGSTQITSLPNVQGDLTLTAAFVENRCTVTFKGFDGSTLDTVRVAKGSDYDTASYAGATPTMTGMRFIGWSPANFTAITEDQVTTAQFEALQTYIVTINYVFSGTERLAADPYVAQVYEGYLFDAAGIASPTIEGYTCTTPVVTFGDPINANAERVVYYEPRTDTPYKVEYYYDDIDGVPQLDESVSLTGTTGELTGVTAQDAADHLKPGFTLDTDVDKCNEAIAADGSTVIKVRFTRELHYVMFDTADGDYVEPIYGVYGAPVTMPEDKPTRVGYTFKGWSEKVTEIQDHDVTITAEWKAEKVDYTVVVWRENADDTNYSVLGTLVFRGKTGDPIVYDGRTLKDKDGKNIEVSLSNGSKTETASYFTYDQAFTEAQNAGMTIAGDGSSIYNAYFSRNVYTANFYVASNQTPATLWVRGDASDAPSVTGFTNYGSPIWTISAKYDADIAARYPVNITFTGSNWRFNGFSRINRGKNSTEVTTTRVRMDPNLCNTDDTRTQNYLVQFTNPKNYVDYYYLLQQPDGTYKEGGFYQRSPSIKPGNITNAKPISGYTMKGMVIYLVNTPDGQGYSILDADGKVNVNNQPLSNANVGSLIRGAAWEPYMVDGKKVNTTFASNYYINIWWYNLNSYNLTFKNVNGTENVSVSYGTSLKSYERGEPTRPFGLNAQYTFTGWYVDQACTVPVDWNSTMPASNLILYAGWAKSTHTVTFDFGYPGAPAKAPIIVKLGEKLPASEIPVRDGYQFNYWSYIDAQGVEKPFLFSMSVMQDYALTAHWTGKAVGYTVRYQTATGGAVYDASGNPIADTVGTSTVGATVTLHAPAAFLDAGKTKLMFPDHMSTSHVLDADSANNVYAITYSSVDAVYYRVQYLDENGAQLDPTAASTPKMTSMAKVTEFARSFPGYKPDVLRITFAMSAETTPESVHDNVITFRYTKNPDGAYTVKYFLQNVQKNRYDEQPGEVEDMTAPVGSIVTAPEKVFLGYELVPLISKETGTVYTGSADDHLTLYLYYRAIPYAVNYALTADVPADVAWQNPNSAVSGYMVSSDEIKLADATLEGFTFDGWFEDDAGTVPVGDPAIASGSTGDRTFYAKFTVNLPTKVELLGYTGTYDGAAHNATVSDPDDELLTTDVVTLAPAEGYTNAADSTQTVTITRNGLVIYTGSANVNIARRPLTVSLASLASVTYNGGEQQTPTEKYTVTPYSESRGEGVLPDDTLAVTVSGDKRTDAGSNAVTGIVTITDASGDVTANYDILVEEGAISIDPAHLTLGVTSLTTLFDGAAHEPAPYAVSGLQGSDTLGAYQLLNMPQTAVGSYANVAYNPAETHIVDATGRDVTANYLIDYLTGSLVIEQPNTTYDIEYYYNGVYEATTTLTGVVGSVITAVPGRAEVGFTYDQAENVPLTLSATAADNIIRVYYVAVETPRLDLLTDAEIPLAGNMASLNVGVGVE